MTELDFENQLRSIAHEMEYPRTPDIAGRVMTRLQRFDRLSTAPVTKPRFSRRLAWSLTFSLVLLFSLFLIPPARAAILDFIQIGIVRIFNPDATPSPAPMEEIPSTMPPLTVTPTVTKQSILPFLARILGETTLADAAQRVNFPILLPTYPSDLGQPDHVFVQDANGEMLILIWLDPQNPGSVLMSLHTIPSGSWAIKKFEPTVIKETSVNGLYAIWTTGPYPLIMNNGEIEITRLVEGHVLIWADGDVTYRLETDLSLEEAIKTAESLEPIP